MGEPVLDLSELLDLYREDARQMIGHMEAAFAHWPEIQTGGAARQELRRLSHQLRGSGRTYGFRNVTRICKGIENITQLLEKGRLRADDRVRDALRKAIARLVVVFAA